MKRRPMRAPAAAGAIADEQSRIRRYALLLLLAGCIVYANSLSNPFVLDDTNAIVGNETIRTLWPLSVPLSPPDETPVARRPLVNLSFAINYAAGGLEVAGYHAVNLAIHLLTALALFGLVRRVLLTGPRGAPLTGAATRIAAVSAVVWTIHPLQTEVVNYISQRTSALMGLCYVLTLYFSMRGHGEASRRWQVATVLACAAGMASKESMVSAPVMVVLLDRVFVFKTMRDAWRQRGMMYAGLASTWLLLAALMASGERTTAGFSSGTTAWTYLLNQLPLIAHYLRLSVWPLDLVVDYGIPQPLAPRDVIGPALLVTGVAIASLVSLVRWPRAGVLGVSLFVLLAPTSSFVPIATEVGAERRMHLPLASLAVLAVCAAWQAAGAVSRVFPALGSLQVSERTRRMLATAAFAGVVVLLALGTIRRNEEYSSPRTLAETIVERRPHGRAYFVLGNALFEEGRRTEAITYFRRAADTGSFPAAHFALGTELIGDGEMDRGIAELREFIRLAPQHLAVSSARQMIATALTVQGRYREAADELRLIEQEGASDWRTHSLFGEVLMRLDRDADAIPHLKEAIRLNAADVRVHNLLGSALARQGEFAAAVIHFRRATELDPGFAPARENLAAAERLVSRR